MPRRLLVLSLALCALLAPGRAHAQDDFDAVLLHGIPGVSVDVLGNGSQMISGFEFGSTADFAVLAGQAVSVELVDADSGDTLTDAPIDLSIPSTGSWTFVAHLGLDEAPTITSFQNDRTPTSDGQGRISFRHVAAAPSVDVVGADGTVFAEAVANANGASFAVPAGSVDDLQVTVAGDDTTVDVPLIEVASGQEVTIYAVGSLVGDTFDFLTLSAVEVGAESGAATTTTTVDAATTTTTTVDAATTTTTTTAAVPGRVDTGLPISDGLLDDPLVVAVALMALSGGFLMLRSRLRPH